MRKKRKKTTEKISKEILNDWKIKRKHCDITKIESQFNLSRKTISNALNLGMATKKVVERISSYYAKI